MKTNHSNVFRLDTSIWNSQSHIEHTFSNNLSAFNLEWCEQGESITTPLSHISQLMLTFNAREPYNEGSI